MAHGYCILSCASGHILSLSKGVDPPKGPVLLNYGIEEARFTKPVYPGSTIQVKFTVKEKVDQEKKELKEDSPKGAAPAKAGQVVASGLACPVRYSPFTGHVSGVR